MASDDETTPSDTPEGRQQSPRADSAAGVAFEDVPSQPDGTGTSDALPLDGSLSLNDTEPLDQDDIHADSDRILTGSEATQTAGGAIQDDDAIDEAVDSKSGA